MEYLKNKGLNRKELKEIKRAKKKKCKNEKLLKNRWVKPKYHHDSHVKAYKNYYSEILRNYYNIQYKINELEEHIKKYINYPSDIITEITYNFKGEILKEVEYKKDYLIYDFKYRQSIFKYQLEIYNENYKPLIIIAEKIKSFIY